MNFVVIIGIIMVWIVVIILAMLIYFGHDVKSRGFAKNNSALTALPMNGIGIKAYFEKRKDHPVVNDEEHRKASVSKVVVYLLSILLVVFILGVLVISLTSPF